jgi:hypothetical protein
MSVAKERLATKDRPWLRLSRPTTVAPILMAGRHHSISGASHGRDYSRRCLTPLDFEPPLFGVVLLAGSTISIYVILDCCQVRVRDVAGEKDHKSPSQAQFHCVIPDRQHGQYSGTTLRQ